MAATELRAAREDGLKFCLCTLSTSALPPRAALASRHTKLSLSIMNISLMSGCSSRHCSKVLALTHMRLLSSATDTTCGDRSAANRAKGRRRSLLYNSAYTASTCAEFRPCLPPWPSSVKQLISVHRRKDSSSDAGAAAAAVNWRYTHSTLSSARVLILSHTLPQRIHLLNLTTFLSNEGGTRAEIDTVARGGETPQPCLIQPPLLPCTFRFKTSTFPPVVSVID